VGEHLPSTHRLWAQSSATSLKKIKQEQTERARSGCAPMFYASTREAETVELQVLGHPELNSENLPQKKLNFCSAKIPIKGLKVQTIDQEKRFSNSIDR
jgi:hypothetical protein